MMWPASGNSYTRREYSTHFPKRSPLFQVQYVFEERSRPEAQEKIVEWPLHQADGAPQTKIRWSCCNWCVELPTVEGSLVALQRPKDMNGFITLSRAAPVCS